METTLPLLCLPPAVLIDVLKQMDHLEVISFSLISDRTRSLAVSLGYKIKLIMFTVSRQFQVYIVVENWRNIISFDLTQRLRPDTTGLWGTVLVASRKHLEWKQMVWEKEGYEVIDWIDHLMMVTHCCTIRMICFDNEEEYISSHAIKNLIQDMNIQSYKISDRCSDQYQQSILETFDIKSLHLDRMTSPSIHNVLAQNYDKIRVNCDVKLDEMLAMNSKVIIISSNQTDWMSVVNKFLKIWKTGSNRRLQHFEFNFEADLEFIVPNILKGIHYTVIPGDVTRRFSRFGYLEERNGGYDFVAKDGGKATIYFETISFVMFVWPM